MRKSEFLPASQEGKLIHRCDPGKKPYAKVEEISTELRVILCPLCGYKEYHQFIRGRAAGPKITLRPPITPHKGGRMARLDIRCTPEIKAQAEEKAARRGISRDDLIEELIRNA